MFETQPPVPDTVYVIVLVPAEIPVMTPLEGFIAAIPTFEELHTPPETVELNVPLPPIHID